MEENIRNKYHFLYLAVFGSIVLAFFSILLFTRPAICNFFDLSKTGQIGDTIGGITAPIFGLFGFILVFYSFMEQFKANQIQISALRDQRIENFQLEQYQILDSLLENLDRKIDLFEIIENRPAVKPRGVMHSLEDIELAYVTSRGSTAINRFCNSHLNENNQYYSDLKFNMRNIPYLADYMYILKQASYIKIKIQKSSIESHKKSIIIERFDLLYKTKLDFGLHDLISKHDKVNGSNTIIIEMKAIYKELSSI